MNTIKFSHDYSKLPLSPHGRMATLLAVRRVKKSQLSEEFIKYNTVFFDESIHPEYFVLSGSEFLLLIFYCEDKIFSTLRPYQAEKEEFFMSKIDQEFKMMIAAEGYEEHRDP